MSLYNQIRTWLTKKPPAVEFAVAKQKEMKELLEGIKHESSQMSEKLQSLDQPDLLRSLVTSMNQGRHS